MTIIVEDGTIVAGAESYITLAEARDYHTKRGNQAWADLRQDLAEQSLVRATDYIEQVYGQSFKGSLKSESQDLSFPRDGIYKEGFLIPSNSIPPSLKKACAELAYKAAQGDLSPDIGRQVLKEKVDVLEVEYSSNSSQITRYRAIDNLLSALMLSHPNGVSRKVVRV